MLDEWNRDLTRLSRRVTFLTLDMIAASGRDDGRRLESEATPVVDALFQLRLVAAIRAAGGRQGAEVLLRDLPEVSPALSEGLDCCSTGVTVPDRSAQSWLRANGGLLERAFNSYFREAGLTKGPQTFPEVMEYAKKQVKFDNTGKMNSERHQPPPFRPRQRHR